MKLNIKQILVPVDGTEASERTFRWACRFAREYKSELHAIYVIEVPLDLPLDAEVTEDIDLGEQILTRAEAIGVEEKFKHVQTRFVKSRQAGPAIVLEAENRNMDVVIVGVPYTRRFDNCQMGPTASYVFHNAPCQVMFWRDQADGVQSPKA